MKKKAAKLMIARETLKTLAAEDLGQAAGGTVLVRTAAYTCNFNGGTVDAGRSGYVLLCAPTNSCAPLPIYIQPY